MPNDHINLYSYFMAHAPAEPWPWFRPTMDEERPRTLYLSEDGHTTYATRTQAERVEGDAWVNPNQKAQAKWDEEFAHQRCIQWPGFWADHMISNYAGKFRARVHIEPNGHITMVPL